MCAWADGDVLANLAPLASFGSLRSCHFSSRPPGRLIGLPLLLAAPRAHGLLGTLRVRALVLVRWPFTGMPRR